MRPRTRVSPFKRSLFNCHWPDPSSASSEQDLHPAAVRQLPVLSVQKPPDQFSSLCTGYVLCAHVSGHPEEHSRWDGCRIKAFGWTNLLSNCTGLAQTSNSKNVFVNDKPLFEVMRSVAIRKGLPKEVKNYLDQKWVIFLFFLFDLRSGPNWWSFFFSSAYMLTGWCAGWGRSRALLSAEPVHQQSVQDLFPHLLRPGGLPQGIPEDQDAHLVELWNSVPDAVRFADRRVFLLLSASSVVSAGRILVASKASEPERQVSKAIFKTLKLVMHTTKLTPLTRSRPFPFLQASFVLLLIGVPSVREVRIMFICQTIRFWWHFLIRSYSSDLVYPIRFSKN